MDEFVRRVADREGVDVPTAERHARAVFAVLGQAVSRQQLDDLAAQLPKDYTPLLPTGARVETLAPGSFLRLVANRAGVRDEEDEAVLETLAERIAGGEVNALIPDCPWRFMSRCGGAANAAAARPRGCRLTSSSRGWPSTGYSVEQARDDGRAVMVTLREAVGDDEFFDVAVQLPREYDGVLAVR